MLLQTKYNSPLLIREAFFYYVRTFQTLMMAQTLRNITVTTEKGIKRPKSINKHNTIIALYSPERIKINAEDFRYVNMNCSIELPDRIIGHFILLPSLRDDGFELTLNRSNPDGRKVQFELLNKNHSKKISVRKKDKLAIFMSINEGTENFKIKYEHF